MTRAGHCNRYPARAAARVLAAAMSLPALAAEGVSQLKDLTDALMVLGQPCGSVTSARSQGKNDHIATCSDGNRYRIYVNGQGRVVAEKQTKP